MKHPLSPFKQESFKVGWQLFELTEVGGLSQTQQELHQILLKRIARYTQKKPRYIDVRQVKFEECASVEKSTRPSVAAEYTEPISLDDLHPSQKTIRKTDKRRRGR